MVDIKPPPTKHIELTRLASALVKQATVHRKAGRHKRADEAMIRAQRALADLSAVLMGRSEP